MSFRYQTLGNRRKPRHTLRWQILSIAAIGTLGFFVFLAVMLGDSKKNADLLKEIRDTRYPVQEALLAALNGLETIDSNLEHAFISANASLLDTSMVQAAQFRANLHKALMLEDPYRQQIDGILSQFDHYFESSHALALSIINNQTDFADTTGQKQLNAQNFTALLDSLSDLQSRHSQALADSVDDATRRASDSLRVGLTTGVLTTILLFVIALVTTHSILLRINNMVFSLRQIAVGNGDMSKRIALTGSDEMTELAFWFNTFIEKLQRVTAESTADVKRLAFTDTLTNLPNRRMFLRCLNNEIERTKTLPDTTIAVMFLDLDNFKPVNDQLGHEAGDELLRAVAQRLLHTVRGTDTVSSDAVSIDAEEPPTGEPVVARLAGDEFMLIVTDINGADQAAKIAERIRIAVMKPYVISGMECSIGVSIGICLYPQNSQDAEDLVTSADMAMYEAKKHGKNTYRFFDPELRNATEVKILLDNAIKEAIPNGELHLMFQPQFSLGNGKLIGAEALLRWEHPQLGAYGPDDFIKQAEANGKICELDDWVLETVLAQMKVWKKNNIQPLQIALNFSAAQASRPSLALTVDRIAGDSKYLLKHLEIEITETSAIDNIDIVESNIKALKAMGIKIAMDDFGAGHSSLTLLTRCEIDTLKIDKGVTSEIKTDPKSRAVVQAIIDLASELKVSTIAEGIEDKAQSQILADMNCDVGQGYYYSQPLSAQELTQFLLERGGDIDKAA